MTVEKSADFRGDAGNDHIYGGKLDDILRGGSGNDFIYGNADDDSITGGTGNDTMSGGSGYEYFKFGLDFASDMTTIHSGDIVKCGHDIITDFDAVGQTHDFLDIENISYAGLKKTQVGKDVVITGTSKIF
jgi:Ca2+-binding RTX toxin-like protein